MMKKLVVIDGNSIINRAFYGLPDLTTTDGRHTNAVLGFINILARITEEEAPTHLAVAFDVKQKTFRHEMYAEYKGTRKPMPKELVEQVPLLKQMLHTMGVLTIENPGFEADDILGALSRKGEEDGFMITLVSGDRDLLQLSRKNVLVRIPKTKSTGTEIEDYTPEQVIEKYGVTPEQITDLKGLMGDASDNIKGVPGIGEKTAVKILKQFCSVEEAILHAREIEPKKAGEALSLNSESATFSKMLATIKTDWEPDFSYERAEFHSLYTKEAYTLCKELELKSFLSRHFSEEKTAAASSPAFQKHLRPVDFTEMKSFLSKLTKNDILGIAMEQGELIVSSADDCVCFSDAEHFAYILHSACEKGVRIASFALKEKAGFIHAEDRENYHDVSLCAYLLNPLKSTYLVEDIARDYLKISLPSAEELLSAENVNRQIYLFDTEEVTEKTKEKTRQLAFYQAETARMACPVLLQELVLQGEDNLYREVEAPLVFVLYEMEQAGMLVEKTTLTEFSNLLEKGINEVEQEIFKAAGEIFNVNSPKQLGVILFEKLKLPYGKKTKTGYSTSADILEKLMPEDPIIEKILTYRQLTKLKSTYADGLPEFIKEDGRIHSKFHQTITATGRLSSTDPNLQNIPIRMELGRKIRKAFVPAKGFVYVDADYSQVELRILAHLSGDEKLISAYNSASDIHRLTASEVFHTPFEEVTDEQRRNAKAVNFGIVYGISSFGLGQGLNISKKEAEEYINRYFETYPKIKDYLNGLVEQAKKTGVVKTMFGRIRPVPEISSSNFMQRNFGERIAMNSPVQGTAADIMKIAMIRVNERLKKEKLQARIVLQVHDELLVEAKDEETQMVKTILTEEMRNAANLSVPLEVSVSVGNDWYDTK